MAPSVLLETLNFRQTGPQLPNVADFSSCGYFLGPAAAISGAVDSSFTLVNSSHGSGRAKLFCIGRDIEYREIFLERNGDNVWEMIADSHEQIEQTDNKIILQPADFPAFEENTCCGVPE